MSQIDPARMQAFVEKVIADIQAVGRSVIGVFQTETDDGFSYSIGNSLNGLPEILIIGLEPNQATGVINFVSSMDPPPKFEDGELIDLGGICPVKVVVAGQKARDEYAVQAGNFLDSDDYPIVQLVVPDKQGRFPGDEGCEEPYASVPVLREPKIITPKLIIPGR